MANNLLRIAVVILCTGALITACQEDYDVAPAYIDSGGPKHRIITGSEAVKKRQEL